MAGGRTERPGIEHDPYHSDLAVLLCGGFQLAEALPASLQAFLPVVLRLDAGAGRLNRWLQPLFTKLADVFLAQTLLATTDANLSTIARRTGYDSEASLSKAFKRAYGRSPGDHRRLLRRSRSSSSTNCRVDLGERFLTTSARPLPVHRAGIDNPVPPPGAEPVSAWSH